MLYLINPEEIMARRKRDARGRFVKTSRARPKRRRARRRNAPQAKRRAAPRRAAPKRRTYRRNPVRSPQLFTMLKDGGIAATQVLVGKALVRSVPQMINLPKGGNVGLAVEAALALGLGYVASMFFSRGSAAAIMAGGLTAPIETLIVARNVPWFSEALSPAAVQASVNGYLGAGRYPQPGQVGRYPQPRPVAALMGYPDAAPGPAPFVYDAHDEHEQTF